MKHTTSPINTMCPDFTSHQDNAYEQWHSANPDLVAMGCVDDEEIDRLADVEFRHCEGH